MAVHFLKKHDACPDIALDNVLANYTTINPTMFFRRGKG
jgi:hypothetical protein